MRLEWSYLHGDDCLRLTGWSQRSLDRLRTMPPIDLARHLPVYPSELVASTAFLPATAGAGGRYALDGNAVCFVPRHPFLAGTSYAVLVHHSLLLDAATDVTTFDLEDFDPITIPRPSASSEPSTRVVAIYPTAATIPRNHLRFYIYFSAPMSEGFVERYVRVVQCDTGAPLTAAFLPMEHELWDPERRRATILFDPARIKRGLAPHEELGYAMREGTPVSLVIDADFRDAEGQPLAAGSARRYEVGPDVRARVRPEGWSVTEPSAGSRDALVVRFDRPLDHALLERCLTVVDDHGSLVIGRASIADGEGSWAFVPGAPWASADHRLVVGTTLEDLAGNSVARVFDRDLTDADHAPITTTLVSINVAIAS